MAAIEKPLFGLLGMNVSGDLADYTSYRSHRGEIVFFPRVPLHIPRSPLQILQRNQFRKAAIEWNALPKETRERWELACRTLSLKITGYGLWVHYQTRRDRAAIETIQRQSGLALLE